MTYARWKDNIADIIAWVSSKSFANKNKIGCYAFSSGTTSALRLAAESNLINFIVSVGTCISTNIGMASGGPAKILSENLESLASGGRKNFLETDFGIDFFIDSVRNAPIHVLQNINCPVLFLQGSADNAFRCADAKLAYDLMSQNGLNVKHIELSNGNHELENVVEEAMHHVFSWLKTIL